MASPTAPSPVSKTGLTIEPISTPLTHQSSQDTLSQPFPSLEEKFTRRSDVSTPATTRANPFETDIEAMPVMTHNSSRRSAECTKGGSDCQVWPGQDHWKRKAKAAKKSRHTCTCLAGMSKRNRILVRVLIVVLVVAIAVGVGFGVSKPLNAGIWHQS